MIASLHDDNNHITRFYDNEELSLEERAEMAKALLA
jgi:hypothetical protein